MPDWFRLDHLTALVLRGNDAEAFAQSQFTADITQFELHRWYPLAWCDARGQALAFLLAARREPDIELILPRSQRAMVGGRLPMFAIGRQVEVTPVEAVAGHLGREPDDDSLVPDGARGLRIGMNDVGDDPASRHAWQLADLAGAIPWLSPETSGRYLPQMLGLEALGGLSYKKGCYPGQEVIARVHYLGKVKRRLAGIVFENDVELPAGQVIVGESGSKVGELIASISSFGRTLALAVVKAQVPDDCRVRTESPDKPISGQVTAPERLC